MVHELAKSIREYKKSMMPYIIGCFLVFGITNFLGIVVEIVSSSLK